MTADALALVAHGGALIWQFVLKERFADEVLEIRIVHPALPYLFICQDIGMLQHEHTDHEAYQFRRAALVGKEPGKLFVQPASVDLVSQHGQRVLHVNDLIETTTEKIVMPRFLLLLRLHLNPQ